MNRYITHSHIPSLAIAKELAEAVGVTVKEAWDAGPNPDNWVPVLRIHANEKDGLHVEIVCEEGRIGPIIGLLVAQVMEQAIRSENLKKPDPPSVN